MKRYLVSAYYSDWVEGEDEQQAIDKMTDFPAAEIKIREFEVTAEESDDE